MPAERSYPFDVFVSYRHQDPDRAWVRGTLAPRLRGGGLAVFLDEDTMVPGHPLIDEMERGVVESRYLVAVLSPRYLTGRFATFEAAMGLHVSVDEQSWRLIPLILEPCELPLRYRTLLALDVSSPDAYEASLTTLEQRLRQAPGT